MRFYIIFDPLKNSNNFIKKAWYHLGTFPSQRFMFSNTNLDLRFYFDDCRRIWISVGIKDDYVSAIPVIVAIGCVMFGEFGFQGKIDIVEQMKRL